MYEGESSNCVYIILYTKLLQLPRSWWTAVWSGRQDHGTSKYLHFFISHASEGSDGSTQSDCELLPGLVTADLQDGMKSFAHAVMLIMIKPVTFTTGHSSCCVCSLSWQGHAIVLSSAIHSRGVGHAHVATLDDVIDVICEAILFEEIAQ